MLKRRLGNEALSPGDAPEFFRYRGLSFELCLVRVLGAGYGRRLQLCLYPRGMGMESPCRHCKMIVIS